jgi:hypothetical protein
MVAYRCRRAVLLVAALGGIACSDAQARKQSPAAETASSLGSRPAGHVVDSILPPGEALRRFRAGLDAPARLDGPARRDELVDRFLVAVRRNDAAALQRLVLNRAEFAYLVFPELKVSRPPYNQPPEIAWMMYDANSSGRIGRLLDRAAAFELLGYRCPPRANVEGRLTVWPGCVVRVRDAGRLRELRLFGAIVEREGHFKLAGFATDL